MGTISALYLWFTDPPGELSVGNAVARAVVITTCSVLLMRAGHRRLMGRNSAVDIVILMTLASVLGRGITGSASVSNTLAAGLVIVGCHYLLAWVAYRVPMLERLLHGHSSILVIDGMPSRGTMCE